MQSQVQALSVRQSQSLLQSLGETIGDIPIYSLHRIKKLINKSGINISDDMKLLLLQKLIEANQQYKEESGNDWSCLTSNNLTTAIENTEHAANEAIEANEAKIGVETLTNLLFS